MTALTYLGLFALIFAQYLTTAIPAYLILMTSLLLRTSVKLPLIVVLYICAWIFYWIAVLSYGAGRNIFTHLLFYSGFLLPFVVIANNKCIDDLIKPKFITALCLLTILEAVLFNSPIAQYLYFFPPDDSNERTAMFGFYQRPLGIAGSAPMTSVVLFFLVVLNERIHGAIRLTTQILIVITTIVLMSGTGFALLLIYVLILAFRSYRPTVKRLALSLTYLAILVMALALAFGKLVELDIHDKFSINYFIFIYDYMMYAIELESYMESDNLEALLLGRQVISDVAGTSGDKGLLGAATYIGLIGAALLIMAPFLYPGALRRNAIVFVFFCLSFVHYMGLLTPPGQVLFACYLCLLARTSRIAKEPLSLLPNQAPQSQAAPSV